MNSIVFLTLITVLLVSSNAEECSIVGRVTTAAGSFVAPDAEVSLFRIVRESRELRRVELVERTRTDESGNYNFTSLEQGSYMVRAELSGFLSEEVWRVRFDNRKVIVDIALTVGAHGDPYTHPHIYGIVRGPKGEAVVDATVTLVRCDNATDRLQSRTDRNGRYELWVREGQYAIQVSKPDLRPSTRIILLEKPVKADFRLKRQQQHE